MRRRLYYGDPTNRAHPLNRGLLARWKSAPWYRSGPRWIDLAGRRHATLTGPPTWSGASSPGGNGSLNLATNGQYLSCSVPIAASSDFTFAAWLYVTSFSAVGQNPGLWRTGSTWNIFTGQTGRPWVFWNGTQILAPGSGYGVPMNEWTRVVYTIKSSDSVQFAANGVVKHTASHAVATPAFTISVVGWQNATSEAVLGFYDDVQILSSYWDSSIIAADYAARTQRYDPTLNWLRRRSRESSAATGNRRRRVICGAAA